MSTIRESLNFYKQAINKYDARLVAISKTKPDSDLLEAYEADQRDFGENKVQELLGKHDRLPKDIRWHMVGHLQRNKVRQIVPFVYMIHGVDSTRLLMEIEKEAKKADKTINVLLQVHIAREETKFGFDEKELIELISDGAFGSISHVHIRGLMGMATFTPDEGQIDAEFKSLKQLFDKLSGSYQFPGSKFDQLSMGMSNDYEIALKNGSTMIRIGSAIFGERNYD